VVPLGLPALDVKIVAVRRSWCSLSVMLVPIDGDEIDETSLFSLAMSSSIGLVGSFGFF
jgi:hypothetical protein